MRDFTNKSIAVIGNAQYLFNRRYGGEIDNHDIIIRMNRAAMLYERFDSQLTHGSRTDVWVMWRHREYENANIVEPETVIQMASWIPVDAPHVAVYDPVYLHNLKVKSKIETPTTGLMVLDLLSHFETKNVSVYGFDWKETPTFTDPNRQSEQETLHDFNKEKIYCREYFSNGLGYLFRF